MEALGSNLFNIHRATSGTEQARRVFETIETMTDDELTLLYENGIEFITWLREKNPSLLKTLALETRERWITNTVEPCG